MEMTCILLVFCSFMLMNYLVESVDDVLKEAYLNGRCYWITKRKYSKYDISDNVCPDGRIASDFNPELVNFLEITLGSKISELEVFVDVRHRDGAWRNADGSVLKWNVMTTSVNYQNNWDSSGDSDLCKGAYNLVYVYMDHSQLRWGASRCNVYGKVLCSAEFWGTWSSWNSWRPQICPESEQQNRTRFSTGRPKCNSPDKTIVSEQIDLRTCRPKRLDILVGTIGQRLQTHTYDRLINVDTMATCAMNCRRQKGPCLSVNYNRETHVCELNDVTMVLNQNDVVAEEHWVNFAFMADETDDGN